MNELRGSATPGHSGRRSTGVVHEDAESTERFHRTCGDFSGRFGFHQVDRDVDQVGAIECSEFSTALAGTWPRAPSASSVWVLASPIPGDGQPYTLRGGGDDGRVAPSIPLYATEHCQPHGVAPLAA